MALLLQCLLQVRHKGHENVRVMGTSDGAGSRDTGHSSPCEGAFTREEGVVHIGGIDALVRLTLDQVRADERRR